MPDTAYTYWYFGEFIVLMLSLWAMMFILDRIWLSNIEREKRERSSPDDRPALPWPLGPRR